jgi:hypothetical protein
MNGYHPGDRGMPLAEWERQNARREYDEAYAAARRKREQTGEKPWIERQKIWTPRDGYGVAGKG